MNEQKSHDIEREQILIELTSKMQTMEGEIGLLRQLGAKARDREREESVKMNNLKERLELEETTCEAITANKDEMTSERDEMMSEKDKITLERDENTRELNFQISNHIELMKNSRIELGSVSSKEECKNVDCSVRIQPDHPCHKAEENLLLSKADENLLSSSEKPKVEENLWLSSKSKVLVATNLPTIKMEKMKKLNDVVANLVKQIGKVLDWHAPFDEVERLSCGVGFVLHDRIDDMKKALEVFQCWKLDRCHLLEVCQCEEAADLDVREAKICNLCDSMSKSCVLAGGKEVQV